MASAELRDIAADAVVSIEDVGSQIENAFAQVGGHLGRTHTIFGDLNVGLASLSQELSGSKIEGASVAFQGIAARLRSLAEMLPVEMALLGTVSTGAAQASKLLTLLVKHTGMVSVIARSSRIEAASLEGDRADFLSFTREASDLASSVQASIVACSKDQEQLSKAIAEVQTKQVQFDRRYRDQLLSVGGELMQASSEITNRQVQSAQLAESAKASTSRIGGAVGGAIVSLQAGDSTRQRLEHICHGLRKITESDDGIVPGQIVVDPATAAPRLAQLQAAQLKDAVSGFALDIDSIVHALTRLAADSASIVAHGHSLYGGKGVDANSFFEVMKQRLARATVLIAASAEAKQSVDDSLAVLENMLGKFRAAIAALDETVIDITLIGMNAGLKAGNLGTKARAFVVIANELKLAADQISAAAKLLEPVLDQIGQAADQLKNMRTDDSSTKVAGLGGEIMEAMREIEFGNGRLGEMMDQLTSESTEFESLMLSAKTIMAALGGQLAALPRIAAQLEQRGTIKALAPDQAQAIGGLFDELYLQYTMDAERDVHLTCSGRLGLPHTAVAPAAASDDSEDALFF
jgi:hypothetical protein